MDENYTTQKLEKLNKFTRHELKADDVYIFSVILCDNEIDRDNERFSVKALDLLAKMFVGKTGIFDHNPKGENQTARIFDTKVEKNLDRKTSTGEPYTYIKAEAYMVRTTKNSDLIKEIDAGIKKEVSVSCCVSKQICSICGTDTKVKTCSHKKGKIYGDKMCHIILDNPTDAYEWSFVAVPAQVNAGVTKHFSSENYIFDDTVTIKSSEYSALKEKSQKNAENLQIITDNLKRDIIKMSFTLHPEISVKALSRIAEGMTLTELISFKDELSKGISKSNSTPQTLKDLKPDNNKQFKL